MLLPAVSAAVLSFLNAAAPSYGTIDYIPFPAILILFLIWTFGSVPPCVFGTLAGRRAELPVEGGGAGGAQTAAPVERFPRCVDAVPRPILADVPRYGRPRYLVPFAGLLSFGSISIELYYVLTPPFGTANSTSCAASSWECAPSSSSSWARRTVTVTYFTLNARNYLWQWTAFASGASTSTAAYVFLYGVYHFLFKTSMNGFLQTAFYFGYMRLIALNLGTLCGTTGHFAASKFVRTILRNVKVD